MGKVLTVLAACMAASSRTKACGKMPHSHASPAQQWGQGTLPPQPHIARTAAGVWHLAGCQAVPTAQCVARHPACAGHGDLAPGSFFAKVPEGHKGCRERPWCSSPRSCMPWMEVCVGASCGWGMGIWGAKPPSNIFKGA